MRPDVKIVYDDIVRMIQECLGKINEDKNIIGRWRITKESCLKLTAMINKMVMDKYGYDAAPFFKIPIIDILDKPKEERTCEERELLRKCMDSRTVTVELVPQYYEITIKILSEDE